MDCCEGRTTSGVIMHARKYDGFHMIMYLGFTLDHYRYRHLPAWFKDQDPVPGRPHHGA